MCVCFIKYQQPQKKNREGNAIAARLEDFDFLITKKKIEDDEKFEDFLNPITEFKVEFVDNFCARSFIYLLFGRLRSLSTATSRRSRRASSSSSSAVASTRWTPSTARANSCSSSSPMARPRRAPCRPRAPLPASTARRAAAAAATTRRRRRATTKRRVMTRRRRRRRAATTRRRRRTTKSII